ncbi:MULTISPECIES: hypothetical protein [unclassified Aeromicrobium]|uniref:hypothetical protein n=1 Tax=unclassified Aeromicrobium TaxID=2633570 RepID=UPI0006FE6DC0|nr:MULTISPECIES: hypothetical protein [unclassified Aeromicrobium]KQO39947.1 hypothetical protein ASF05_15065 [Aeromicrobium sp. Leaf245]KQP25900.1 hypothetical protein ASF38_09410 [Aeromicrobium sp. Leaf272]
MGELLTILVTAERPRGLDPNIVRPGWLALGIVAALAVAVFFLAKSFAKHTKKAAQPWEGDQADDVTTSTNPSGAHDDRD